MSTMKVLVRKNFPLKTGESLDQVAQKLRETIMSSLRKSMNLSDKEWCYVFDIYKDSAIAEVYKDSVVCFYAMDYERDGDEFKLSNVRQVKRVTSYVETGEVVTMKSLWNDASGWEGVL